MKIGIVGAGPRGLSLCERLTANHQEGSLEIFLFDADGIGGKVWREDQSPYLMMNSVAQQVTLFTDDTVKIKGKIKNGPDLFQWCKKYGSTFIEETAANPKILLEEIKDLKEDGVVSRVMYGFYQRWFYQQIINELPSNCRINFLQGVVQSAEQVDEGYKVTVGNQEFFLDQLVLATGHWENEKNEEEQRFSDYAEKYHLFYQMPRNTADAEVEQIPAGENVFLRGLGLAFFDYIECFALRRGGKFYRRNGKLRYQPSGKEPKVYAGSRKGIPYFPRGINQKERGVTAEAQFLTTDYLEQIRQAQNHQSDFFERLKKEVELVYYLRTLAAGKFSVDSKDFRQTFIHSSQDGLAMLPASIERWDWDKIADPATYFEGPFEQAIMNYLEWQIQEAAKGNLNGPIAAAVDVWKDLRDKVRFMLDHDLFSQKQLKTMWQWFTPLDAFLTIGPPLERSEELRALIEAGIFVLLPPKMTIDTEDGHFVSYYKEQKITGDYLIEARLPSNQLLHTTNPVLKSLRKQKLLTPFAYFDDLQTGAVTIERGTNRVIDEKGVVHKKLYCYGIPVEGEEWLTASVSRPETNAWNLRQADQIVWFILYDK